MDLLAAGYSGLCYIFYGNKDGSLNEVVILKDKSGEPIHLGMYMSKVGSKTELQGDYIKTDFVKAHDWDNDGDLDLLISIAKIGVKGEPGVSKVETVSGVKLRINEGNGTNPVFGTENIDVLPEHFADAMVDWDGDGLWDILGGSLNGGVYFYKNTGKLGNPSFKKAKCLIKPSEFVDKTKGGKCGITQITVADYNHDGKLDLIIGNKNMVKSPDSPKLTTKQMKEKALLEKKNDVYMAMYFAYMGKYYRKYGNNREKIMEAQKDDEAYNKYMEEWNKNSLKLRAFPTEKFDYHGYVWVSLRE